MSDKRSAEWRDGNALIICIDPATTRWGDRYTYRHLMHESDDDVLEHLRRGGELISPEGVLALLETHGVGPIDPPVIDGWGREGLIVFLADGHRQRRFSAGADLTDDDIRAEVQKGGRLVTCDEFTACFEEHIALEAPPYLEVLVQSWRDARARITSGADGWPRDDVDV